MREGGCAILIQDYSQLVDSKVERCRSGRSSTLGNRISSRGADDNSSCDERSCIALRELPEDMRFDPGQFELCSVNPIGILSIVV